MKMKMMKKPSEMGHTPLMLLGLLAEQKEATGRRLLELCRAELGFRGFDEVVYMVLARLDRAGYVTHRDSPRVYAITAAGRREYRDQLAFFRLIVDRFQPVVHTASRKPR